MQSWEIRRNSPWKDVEDTAFLSVGEMKKVEAGGNVVKWGKPAQTADTDR